MEHLEIVNELTGEPLGVVLPRPQAIQEKAWCKSTNIYVLNSAGEVLCHRRPLTKERWPGYWMTHLGGHVGANETYESNAVKELGEEAGIHVNPEELVHWRTTRIPHARLWTKEYVVVVDRPADDLPPQPGEIEEFAWKRPETIIQEYTDGLNWCAGTLDFWTEYHCLRAALTAAHSQAEHDGALNEMTKWHKLSVPYVATLYNEKRA